MAAKDFTDFIKDPRGASRRLHVTPQDVRSGEMQDAWDRFIRSWPASGEGYGQTREADLPVEDPRQELVNRYVEALRQNPLPYPRIAAQQRDKAIADRQRAYGEKAPTVKGDFASSLEVLWHALKRDEEAKTMAKTAALGAGIAGGVAAPMMMPAAPVLSGATINALSGLLPNLAFDAPEGVAQDALAGALMGKYSAAGKAGLGALSGLGSYLLSGVPEAEAMAFTGKFLPRFKNMRGDVGHIPLYVNPTSSEIASMWKTARELAREQGSDPAIRLMHDRRSPSDVYAWDGTDTLHKEAADALDRPMHEFTGMTIEPRDDIYKQLEYLRGLKQDTEPPLRFAGGGVVKRGALSLLRGMGALPEAVEGMTYGRSSLPTSVVKPKGGNWLSGSVENALAGLKRSEGFHPDFDVRQTILPDGSRLNEITGEVLPPLTKKDPLNSWIEGPLTKYVKTRMASPEDEVRRLAEQGVLHFTPEWIPEPGMARGIAAQLTGGNFGKELGKSELAKSWEALTDQHLDQNLARDFLYDQKTPYKPGNEWLTKVDQRTPVYGLPSEVPTNLGFNHLIDELSNALNPNSGLPPHLQLTPEAVKNMSMEKAVRRVADINARRAAVQAAANAELANKAMVVREYTENNPKGLRWVELKKQEALPEGWTLKPGEGEYAGHDWFFDPQGKAHNALNDPRNQMLADQLKYEGDAMGHCVGGYCPDVLEGRSRIFSLRDAKGEPHVTVETKNNPWISGEILNNLESGIWDRIVQEGGHYDPKGWLKANKPELLDKLSFPSIVQIKGKANRAPNPEYLPFVQDFVRNSPLGGAWSDVGDLQNAGLTGIGGKYFSEPELRKAYDAAGFSIPFEGLGMDYMDMIARKNLQADRADAAFLKALGFDFTPVQKASGGHVQKQPAPPDSFQGIIAALEQELA